MSRIIKGKKPQKYVFFTRSVTSQQTIEMIDFFTIPVISTWLDVEFSVRDVSTDSRYTTSQTPAKTSETPCTVYVGNGQEEMNYRQRAFPSLTCTISLKTTALCKVPWPGSCIQVPQGRIACMPQVRIFQTVLGIKRPNFRGISQKHLQICISLPV
jgi:hypothetical protein